MFLIYSQTHVLKVSAHCEDTIDLIYIVKSHNLCALLIYKSSVNCPKQKLILSVSKKSLDQLAFSQWQSARKLHSSNSLHTNSFYSSFNNEPHYLWIFRGCLYCQYASYEQTFNFLYCHRYESCLQLGYYCCMIHAWGWFITNSLW